MAENNNINTCTGAADCTCTCTRCEFKVLVVRFSSSLTKGAVLEFSFPRNRYPLTIISPPPAQRRNKQNGKGRTGRAQWDVPSVQSIRDNHSRIIVPCGFCFFAFFFFFLIAHLYKGSNSSRKGTGLVPALGGVGSDRRGVLVEIPAYTRSLSCIWLILLSFPYT